MSAIGQIDKQIDLLHATLFALEKPKMTAESWQAAWDRHPEMQKRDRELFAQRAAARQERDERAARAIARPRRYRRKKCPTCGRRTVIA